MKKKSKKQRKMNRTRKKKGAQHSTLAKQAMIKSAENKLKKFQREFTEKVKNLDKLNPSQLLRRRPKRIDPNQLQRGNLPYPNIGGGKRHNRKRRTRKRKSRRKKKRRRTKKK